MGTVEICQSRPYILALAKSLGREVLRVCRALLWRITTIKLIDIDRLCPLLVDRPKQKRNQSIIQFFVGRYAIWGGDSGFGLVRLFTAPIRRRCPAVAVTCKTNLPVLLLQSLSMQVGNLSAFFAWNSFMMKGR